MLKAFDYWPFQHPDELTEGQQRLWWQECFLPDRAYEILRNQQHWIIVVGPPGSGKTTLLQAFKHVSKPDNLVIDVSQKLETRNNQASSNLFYHIMISLAQEFYYRFRENQDLIVQLSRTQREFFRWLVEKFNGERAYSVFVDGLKKESRNAMQSVSSTDLYPTQTEQRDVQGQIDELVNICRTLGYQNLAILIDIAPYASEQQLTNLASFLGWLEPMHHRGFMVVTAVTDTQYQKYDLLLRTRGRVVPIYVHPQPAQTKMIISKHLSLATGSAFQSLDEFNDRLLIKKIEHFIEKEFGTIVPGPLLAITKELLQTYEWGEKPSYDALCASFFANHMPLRFDPNSQHPSVWRGHQYITLEKNVFELLIQLSNRRKTESGKGYLHSRASKLRRAIEPNPTSKERVYLKNSHDEGYWLENFVYEQVSDRKKTGSS